MCGYKKEDEDMPHSEMGYPYNVISKGYPNKVSNEKINETVDKILEHLKNNLGVESFVSSDTAFINLGLNELSNRKNERQSKSALILSIVSIGLSFIAIVLSVMTAYSSSKDTMLQEQHLSELKNISKTISQ